MPDIGEQFSVGESATEDFMASLTRDLAGAEPTPAGTPPVEGTSVTPPVDDNSGTPSEPDWKKQYEELHSLMGRMSTELGELRKQVTPEPTPDPYEQVYAPITDEVEQQLADAIARSGGEALARWAATSRPDLYETVLDLWADPDISGDRGGARKAAAFDLRFQTNLQRLQAEEDAAENEEFVNSIGDTLGERVAALAPEYGLQAGHTDVDAVLANVLDNAPAQIQALVVSKDEGERDAGLRVILQLAAAQVGVKPPVDPAAAAQAAAQARGAASFGLGTGVVDAVTPTVPPSAVVATEDKVASALAAKLLEMPSTSVAAGLKRVGDGG